MIKIRIDEAKFENLKNRSLKCNSSKLKRRKTFSTLKKVGSVANELLGLVEMADNKVGKSAKLIRELIRIFNS